MQHRVRTSQVHVGIQGHVSVEYKRGGKFALKSKTQHLSLLYLKLRQSQMTDAQDTQYPPQGQTTNLQNIPYRPHLIPVSMSRANSDTATSTTLAEEGQVHPVSRPSSERTSNTSESDRILFTTGVRIFQASHSHSSHSSYARPAINERNQVLTTIDVMENTTLQLLLNLATERPALFHIEGRELEWLQRRANYLGYQLDAERAVPSIEPQPNALPNAVHFPSSSNSYASASSHDNRSIPDEPVHAVHRPLTPIPGRRSDEPPSSESAGSGSYPDSNRLSTLPNLPGLFHDWLTNPVTYAQVSGAIDACQNERVRSYACRYIELTEGIRHQ